MAVECLVSTAVTAFLNCTRSSGVVAAPRALAMDFSSDPRWSIAAAAITPFSSAQALMPANLPLDILTLSWFSPLKSLLKAVLRLRGACYVVRECVFDVYHE